MTKTLGLIGAGMIGATVARLAVAAGRDVVLAAAAFHPGLVATHFAAESRSWLRHVYRLSRPFPASPDKSVAQLAWLAQGSPDTDWQPGAYYERYRPAKRNDPQTLTAEPAMTLWIRTEALLADALPHSPDPK